MQQVLVFCRTNYDCDNLEAFLVAAGGGKQGRPGAESGKENPYSCCVLAGARSMEERRRNLQGEMPVPWFVLFAPDSRSDATLQRLRKVVCAF